MIPLLMRLLAGEKAGRALSLRPESARSDLMRSLPKNCGSSGMRSRMRRRRSPDRIFDDREEWPIGDDQVVEALTDAPFVLARLPVDLFGRELTECAIRLVGDLAALREKRGEVECHP